ncbi:MAG: hypothetical protein ACP5JP_03400 [bacterium]
MRSESRNNFIIFLFIVILSLIITYPGIASFNTRLLGIKDSYFYAWDLWWFKHALYTLHQSPLKLQTIFYPINGIPYVWSSPLNEILGIVLLPIFPLTFLFNILALLPIVLGTYFTYKLVYYLTKERLAGIMSGVLFGFSPFILFTMMGNLQYASIEFIPLVVFTLLKLKEEQSLKNGIMFIVASVLLAMSSSSYIFYAYIPLILYLPVSWLVTDGIKPFNRLLLIYIFLSIGFVTLVALIFYAPQLYVIQHSEYVKAEGVSQLLVNNQNFLDYFLPNKANFFFKHILFFLSKDQVYYSNIGIISLLLIILAIAFKYEKKELLRWGILAILVYIFSLGPYLKFNGYVMFPYYNELHFIPLPYILVTRIKLLKDLTQPYLLIPLLLFITAVMSGFGAKLIIKQTGMKLLSTFTLGSLLVLALVEYYPGYPFPSVQSTMPAYYELPRKDINTRAIIELPASASVFDNIEDIPFIYRSMYYQMFTHKALVGGYYPYQWDRAQSFIKTTPFLSQLDDPFILRYGDIIPVDKKAIANYGIRQLIDLGINYVVVNRLAYDQQDYNVINDLLRTYCGAPFYDDGYVSIFLLTKAYLSIHPGELIELGSGWYKPQINVKEKVIFRVMSQDGVINVLGVEKPRMVRLVMGIIRTFKSIQFLTLDVNGTTVDRIDLGKLEQPAIGWMSSPFMLKKGDNTIIIHSVDPPVNPFKEIGPVIQDTRPVTIGVFGLHLSDTTVKR